jgi:hypothetical protein
MDPLMIEPTPYFELDLTLEDGTRVDPARFRTVQDAITAALDYARPAGGILYYGEPGEDPVTVIVYNPDGTIEAGPTIPDDDDDEYADWTEEEIDANFAAGRPPTAAERAQFGIPD